MKEKNKEFWVINVSKKNVMLSDLALVVRVGQKFNLLDQRHFKYTIDQLEKSLKDGSLFKKRDKIIFCKGKPEVPKLIQKEISEQPMIVKPKSAVKVTTPKYDELIYSDEEYANEISDLFSEKKD